MRVSAKADYAVRAAIELAASDGERPVKKQEIVENQKILSAREVVKASDLPGGFSTGALGPLGVPTVRAANGARPGRTLTER